MTAVLSGIRVIDFGRYIAGPYCGALLADMGADVIRVDKVEGSEDRFQVPMAETGEGGMYFQMNRNKRGLTLNPTAPEGREIVRRLVGGADVVIANLPPDTLESMGLDYRSLTAIKPDIILTTVSAFGHGGPYSNRVGFDGIGQAMCGAAYMTGWPDQPYTFRAPWVDVGTALACAFGTLAALMHRQATGEGQMVEGSLLRTALTVSNSLVIEQAVNRPDRVPTGNRSQVSGPADIFRCRDGHVLISVNGNPLFRRWCRMVGAEEWLDDPRFATDEQRGIHGALLSRRTQDWCGQLTVAEALAQLETARVPAGPVLTPQGALDDPHIQAMGFYQPLAFPGLTVPAPVVGTQIGLSATPGTFRQRAPMLGEHTDEILGQLGYDAAQIADLRQRRIV